VSLDVTSGLLAFVVVACAVALPVVAIVLWGRVRGPGVARDAQRWLMVVASQLLAVVAVGVVVNDQFGFYSSWDDLLGRASTDSAAGVIHPVAPHGTTTHPSGGTKPGGVEVAQVPWVGGVPAGFTAWSGEPSTYVAQIAITGSSAPQKVYVYLPPQYFEASQAHARFPVVELLHGYPGSPTTWFHAMDVLTRYQAAVAAGGAPYILVVPQISVTGAPDLECTDLPGQPQIASFLTTGLHDVITSHFRTRTDPAGWGLMGYSEGGYCAAQLTLRHPDLYGAGVDIAGYDQPLSSLFDGFPAQRAAGRLSTLLAARPGVALFASASKQDPESSGSIASLTKAVRPPTRLTTVMHAQGGHNTADWSAELPADFLWLTQHLGGVVA
jgi:enterochelin esterase-like enzyme